MFMLEDKLESHCEITISVAFILVSRTNWNHRRVV